MIDLLTVGECFEDLVFAGLRRMPRLGEELRVTSFSKHLGGGAAITAVAARRLGLQVSLLSAVSETNAESLRRDRVSTINVREAAEAGAVTVALSTIRDRAFVTHDGVNAAMQPRLLAALDRLSRRPRHVHFALVPRDCAEWGSIVGRLRQKGVTTSWDFGWQPALLRDEGFAPLSGAVDCLFLNEREVTLYSRTQELGSAFDAWRSRTHQVVVKLGDRGAAALTRGKWMHAPARKVRTRDTTGAGDAFNAGFIAACLHGASLRNALRLGNYLGSCSIEADGGIDGLPARADLPLWAQQLLSRDARGGGRPGAWGPGPGASGR